MTNSPIVEAFFEGETNTVTYLVYDRAGGNAVIIDPVLNFFVDAGRTSTESADLIISRSNELELTIDYIFETHAHADHISSAPYLKSALGGIVAIGAHITETQAIFKTLYNLGNDFKADGSQFDQLLSDGDCLNVGDLSISVMHTPGHTPACVSYHVGDAIFVGDTLFMPDYGTARCDFPGGSAATLYQSIQKILSLSDETRVFTGHDYGPNGRDFAWQSTVGEQKATNIHIGGGVTQEDFVQLREARDSGLNPPKLLLPSIQINIRAGATPEPESNGGIFLKIPLNIL